MGGEASAIPSSEESCETIWSAICSAWRACDHARYRALFVNQDGEDRCASDSALVCAAQTDAVGYPPASSLDTCARSLANNEISCGSFLQWAATRNVLSNACSLDGPRQAGESCQEDVQCASRLCNKDLGAECGSCLAVLVEGASCDGVDGVCEPGAKCFTIQGAASFCVFLPGRGEPCLQVAGLELCDEGLACVDGNCRTNKSEPPLAAFPAEGEPCRLGDRPYCARGTTCLVDWETVVAAFGDPNVDGDLGKCTALKTKGKSCAIEGNYDPAGPCEYPLECIRDKCRMPIDLMCGP